MIYLDNAATTKQQPEVTGLMTRWMEEEYGNPSSLHRMGHASEKGVRRAREQVATCLGVHRDEIYFTSGGTMADNLAVIGAARVMARKGDHIITTAIEHPAVLEACRYLEKKGFRVTYLGVDAEGIIDLEKLEETLEEKTILVSVMHVNNETGAIQPLEVIGSMVKARSGTVFHTDAVQSLGKMVVPITAAKLDLVSGSAHKIYGPKGSGMLYVNKNTRIEPLTYGGGQEKDIHPGTENTPAIVGFGQATELAREAREENWKQVSCLKEHFIAALHTQLDDIKVNGNPTKDSPYILNMSFPGTRAEVLLHMLEQSGIYVSTGSACSSHKKGKSHVLTAMKLRDREIESALRFSFSIWNTIQEMEFVAEKVKDAVNEMRKTFQTRAR